MRRVAGCALASRAITLAAGGSLADALKAAAFAFVQSYIWPAVGEMLGTISSVGDAVVKAAVHGVIGGALSVAQGGTFLQGFAGSAAGALGGFFAGESTLVGQYGDGDSGNILARALISGAAGCAGAVITGGKCAEAALTAGFAHLYNFEASAARVAVKAAGAAIGGPIAAVLVAMSEIFGSTPAGDYCSDKPQQCGGQHYVVRAGLAAENTLEAGTRLTVNGSGFSVQTFPGISVDELARGGGWPHKYISVTTIDMLRAIPGVTVNWPTPGAGSYHGTVNVPNPPPPGTFEAISKVFAPVLNPHRVAR